MSANRILHRTFLVLLLVLAVGCAHRLPQPGPLAPARQAELRARLADAPIQRIPRTLDLDLHIEYRGYGHHYTLPATLQMDRQGLVRVSGLDPLGRPLFLFTADSQRFTLVDPGQGRALTGPFHSRYLGQYLPAGLDLTTCFDLLAARLPPLARTSFSLGSVADSDRVWVVLPRGGNTLQAELDPDTMRLVRQALLDGEATVLVETEYEYRGKDRIPARIVVSGGAVSGTVELSVDKIYDGTPDPLLFRQRIPEFFPVTEVE